MKKPKSFNKILYTRIAEKVRRNAQFTLNQDNFIKATYTDINMKWIIHNCHKAGKFQPMWKRHTLKALTRMVVNYYAKKPQLLIAALRTK